VPGLAADDDPDKRDYKIGYGKPPKSGQFKPGKSGNPKGRPKGAKNFATILARELDKPIYIVEDGRRRRASRREVIVLQLIKRANAGDLKASLELIKLETQFSGSSAHPGADPAPDREVEQIDQDIIDAALADLLRNAGAASRTTQSSTSRDEEED
jgi:hypothetical protein